MWWFVLQPKLLIIRYRLWLDGYISILADLGDRMLRHDYHCRESWSFLAYKTLVTFQCLVLATSLCPDYCYVLFSVMMLTKELNYAPLNREFQQPNIWIASLIFTALWSDTFSVNHTIPNLSSKTYPPFLPFRSSHRNSLFWSVQSSSASTALPRSIYTFTTFYNGIS